MPGDINSERERSFDTSNFAQPLAEAEVDGYLTWQFRVAARRPKALTLRETAAVARYLLCLALHGVPKEIVDGGPDAVRKHWRDHLLKGERNAGGKRRETMCSTNRRDRVGGPVAVRAIRSGFETRSTKLFQEALIVLVSPLARTGFEVLRGIRGASLDGSPISSTTAGWPACKRAGWWKSLFRKRPVTANCCGRLRFEKSIDSRAASPHCKGT
jgi:phage gp36-like protein